MIVGTGVDVCDIRRIQQALERHGQRFLERVFTPAEVLYCQGKRRPEESLAARFAAKEAVAKALGTGMANDVSWQHVEVVQARGGRPGIQLYGRAAECAAQMGVSTIHLSLSHGLDTAVAFVVLEDRSQL